MMRSTTGSLDVTIAPVVEERRLLWTMRDNLHTWFLGFKEFLLNFKFAMLDGTGELIFSPEMLRQVVIVDETKVSLDWWEQYAGRWTSGHVLSRPPSSTDYEVGCKDVI